MVKNVMLREFLKNYRRTGTITPSSPSLIKKMLAPINFDKARCIVELGAGEGCITRALLRKMNHETKLISFEQNPEIFNELNNIQDSRLAKVNDSAENIQQHLQNQGFEKADYIVSGLPLVFLPKEEGEAIINQAKANLHQDGKFIQFQYSLKSLKDFKQKFAKVKVTFTLWNIPPAFVYSCKI